MIAGHLELLRRRILTANGPTPLERDLRATLDALVLSMHRLQDYEASLQQATSLLQELEEIRIRLELVKTRLASVSDSHPTDQAS